MVLNDEGHHCWRPAPEPEDLGGEKREADAEAEREEARVWLDGLDRINNCWVDRAGRSLTAAAQNAGRSVEDACAGLRPVDRMKSGPQAESLPHKGGPSSSALVARRAMGTP